MIKITGFCVRHPSLSHEEYRAGHAGYHVSLARRLKRVRGYVNNVWTDRGFDLAMPGAGFGQPPEFFDVWDGYSEIWFDSFEDYFASKDGEPDRAGDGGLVMDDLTKIISEDNDRLYYGAAHQFSADEHIIVPVARPERHITKLQQWGRRRAGLSEEEFVRAWVELYAPLYTDTEAIRGYLVNFRRDAEVMAKFFVSKRVEMAYSEDGIARREQFYAFWDGFAHVWIDDLEALRRFRAACGKQIEKLERELFDGLWYREVVETVGVLPRRDTALAEYRR